MRAAARPRPAGRGLRQLAAATVALVLLPVLGGAHRGGAAPLQAHSSLYAGLGFDTCDAPPITTLQAWLASPYRALGIYVGGADRACANAQLSASWVSSAEALGWALAPLYVGLQAPCTDQPGLATIDPDAAAAEGAAAAADAMADAGALGLPAGSPIYFDMEAYALDSPSCTQTVQTFLTAWVGALHAQGYLAGVYGSAASTMRDVQALSDTAAAPDDIWIADWDGDTSVFGDPYVSDTLWSDHERVHQFSGGHVESYGGVSLEIDGDVFDGAVVGGSGAAAPAPAPAAAAPSPSTAGSVSTADGVATVTWPEGTFDQPVVVSLTPSLPSEPVAGFGAGGYGVRLQVQQTATALPAAAFRAPLTIEIAPEAGRLAPMSSADGERWQALPELVGGLLPDGARAGYAREPGGAVEIQTRSPGMFALLPDTTPPPAPASLAGRFSDGALVLDWPAASGAAGGAVGYEVTLANRPLLTTSGETTAALTAFERAAPSVFRVRAIDAAGNLSSPSPPLVVLPSPRPRALPRALPAWTWTLAAWQRDGRLGPRPSAPHAPHAPPRWYWLWEAWRFQPYHVRA